MMLEPQRSGCAYFLDNKLDLHRVFRAWMSSQRKVLHPKIPVLTGVYSYHSHVVLRISFGYMRD